MKEGKQNYVSTTIPGSILKWFQSGDPVPKTHRNGLPITFSLLIIGFIALACALAPFYGYTNGTIENHTKALFFLSFLAFTPSVYNCFIMFCCWRRIPGYRWSMIPFFE